MNSPPGRDDPIREPFLLNPFRGSITVSVARVIVFSNTVLLCRLWYWPCP